MCNGTHMQQRGKYIHQGVLIRSFPGHSLLNDSDTLKEIVHILEEIDNGIVVGLLTFAAR